MTEATLVFLLKGDQILLAMKKRGFGQGRWNGIGGKVQSGESARDAAVRETKEEVGILPEIGDPVGHLTFRNSSKGDWVVHVFRADRWVGEPIETEEMKPQWFTTDPLPFDSMWPDDRIWMPYFLEGKKFNAEFWFANDDTTIARHTIEEVSK